MISYKQINQLVLSNTRRMMVFIPLIQSIGETLAIMLSDIIDWQDHLEIKGQLEADGSFYYLQSFIQKKLNWSETKVYRNFKELKALGILTVERRGMPAKNYITLNQEKITQLLLGVTDQDTADSKDQEPLKATDQDTADSKDLSYSDVKDREQFDRESLKTLSAPDGAPPVDQDKSPLPKRTKPIVPPTAPADPGELCEFVEYWNEQENTPKHRQPSTGVYKQAAKHCNQLRHGIFGRSVELKPEWLANKHIPPDLPRKKWTREEIKEGIRRMALMYKDGYWPPKKDSLPRSFQAMLYNPKSGGSWFLWVMSSEPRPIADKVAPLDDVVHAMYRKLFKGKALTDAEETKLVRMVNLLVGKQREVAQHLEPYLGHTSFSGKFGSRNNRFFQTHIDWLTGWCEDIRVETVWKTWGAFVRWARDFHKMEIEPSNDNVRHAKQAHRRAEEDRRRREESAERSRLSELAHLV